MGLNVDAFMGPRDPFGRRMDDGPETGDDLAVVDELMKQHAQMRKILQGRMRRIQVLKTLWMKGNITSVMEQLELMQDDAVTCDIFKLFFQKPVLVTVAVALLVAPVAARLLNAQFEDHIITGLRAIRMLCKRFTKSIVAALRGDLTADDEAVDDTEGEFGRADMLHALADVLVAQRPVIQMGIEQPGKMGTMARESFNYLQRIYDALMHH